MITKEDIEKAAATFVSTKSGYNTPTGREIFHAGAQFMQAEIEKRDSMIKVMRKGLDWYAREAYQSMSSYPDEINEYISGDKARAALAQAKRIEEGEER